MPSRSTLTTCLSLLAPAAPFQIPHRLRPPAVPSSAPRLPRPSPLSTRRPASPATKTEDASDDGRTWVFDDAVGSFVEADASGTPADADLLDALAASLRAEEGGAAAADARETAAAAEEEIVDDAHLLSMVKRTFLQELCASNRLSKSGTKAELLARLRKFAEEKGKESKDGSFFYFDGKNPPKSVADAAAEEARRIEAEADVAPATEAAKDVPTANDASPPRSDAAEDDGAVVRDDWDYKTPRATTGSDPLPPPPSSPGGPALDDNAALLAAGADNGQGASLLDTLMPVSPLFRGDDAGIGSVRTDPDTGLTYEVTYRSDDRNDITGTEGVDERPGTDSATGREVASPAARTEGAAAVAASKERCLELIGELCANGDCGTRFDAAKVSADRLLTCSEAMLARDGQGLDEAVQHAQLYAVGQDGRAGDDATRGGGHYRNVERVATFLRGYRAAEARRVSRETVRSLLDAVAKDGPPGLDRKFEGLRSADRLNDDLVRYLDELVQKQKRAVRRLQEMPRPNMHEDMPEVEFVARTDEVDGEVVETLSFDPDDLRQVDFGNTEDPRAPAPPVRGPDLLLFVLRMLHDRVRVEALFPRDERGQNLRLLSRALRAGGKEERRQAVAGEVGRSLERTEMFKELVEDSIKFARSGSAQIGPGRANDLLDVKALEEVREIIREIERDQTRGKAPSASSNVLRP